MVAIVCRVPAMVGLTSTILLMYAISCITATDTWQDNAFQDELDTRYISEKDVTYEGENGAAYQDDIPDEKDAAYQDEMIGKEIEDTLSEEERGQCNSPQVMVVSYLQDASSVAGNL